MNANPYESPVVTDAEEGKLSAQPPFTLWGATQYVLLTSGGGMLLGALLGLIIGFFFPDYYRTVFRLTDESPVGIVGLGIVLGATQGLVFGAMIGTAIVAIYAWYLTRAKKMLG